MAESVFPLPRLTYSNYAGSHEEMMERFNADQEQYGFDAEWTMADVAVQFTVRTWFGMPTPNRIKMENT